MCTVARKQVDITKHGDRRKVFITKWSLVTIIWTENKQKAKRVQIDEKNVEHLSESRKCELFDFTLSDMYIEWVLMLPG